MAIVPYREGLSLAHKIRRSYYELLRDDLDQFLLNYGLLESYKNFTRQRITYPFVEKREFKPRARINNKEYELQNNFLVMFLEDCLGPRDKKYIRFFDSNKVTKTNMAFMRNLPLDGQFDRTTKFVDNVRFKDLMTDLLKVDYGLLVQRDYTVRSSDRYSLSHFHVKVDWPITDAAEDLGKYLRYISKDLFEKGDKYAEDMQKKFFEYYNVPMMSGGRRTAAIVAARYLEKIEGLKTIYVSSSESRTLLRIAERGVSRTGIVRLTPEEVQRILAENDISATYFRQNYVIDKYHKDFVCLLQVMYMHTLPAYPPEEGRLRELKPDLSWLTVSEEYITPLPGNLKPAPLKTSYIYT